jgi:hypothetical protein
VNFAANISRAGDMVQVKITASLPNSLRGEVVL